LLEYISKITNKPKKDNNPNSRDNIYNIVITREDAIIFCENIYYKDCFSMKRKYELSKEVKKWIRPDDMKKRDFDYKKWTKDENDYILNHTIEESIEKLNRTKKSIQIRLIRLKNNFLY